MDELDPDFGFEMWEELFFLFGFLLFLESVALGTLLSLGSSLILFFFKSLFFFFLLSLLFF